MTEHRDTEQIQSDGHPKQIESEGAGQVPYTEPVLRELGTLRDLTSAKSGEKYTVEKSSVEKSTRGG
jgi:hypothetical protein